MLYKVVETTTQRSSYNMWNVMCALPGAVTKSCGSPGSRRQRFVIVGMWA